MSQKSVEIVYDLSAIPGIRPSVNSQGLPGFWEGWKALRFRNRAMRLIEAALVAEQEGEWGWAEIGMGEVNFGFDVQDFDRAEAIVRRAVQGSRYADITRIERREMSDADCA